MTTDALTEHAAKNRAFWDGWSDEYQATNAPQLNKKALAWGVWALPESELNVLGDIADKDILEFGCGAAQWSIFLAKLGARPVGLDNSARQLEHARRLMAEHGVDFPLIHASAESVPLPDNCFDIVFCDHGAMSFADPYRTVPEAARLLRPGGLLAFNMSSKLWEMCWDEGTDTTATQLRHDYFGQSRFDDGQSVNFNLTYGEWIRLFRQHEFIIEDLIEPQPPEDATTTYGWNLAWARRWPAENIWKVRKSGS